MSYLNKENLYFEKYEKNVETVEKTEKLSEKGNSAKLDSELENLYQKLCRNLEDNSQLNDLFRRFFQTKTKLAFLLEEKDYQLILMKFLQYFPLKIFAGKKTINIYVAQELVALDLAVLMCI